MGGESFHCREKARQEVPAVLWTQGWFKSEVEGLGIKKHGVRVEKKCLQCFFPDEKASAEVHEEKPQLKATDRQTSE